MCLYVFTFSIEQYIKFFNILYLCFGVDCQVKLTHWVSFKYKSTRGTYVLPYTIYQSILFPSQSNYKYFRTVGISAQFFNRIANICQNLIRSFKFLKYRLLRNSRYVSLIISGKTFFISNAKP